MDRKEMLQQCQRQISLRRATAHSIANKNLALAKDSQAFLELEKKEKLLTFEIGKLRAFDQPYTNQEKELALVKEEKSKALSSIGLTFEDLKPKYVCDLCGDTGYIHGEMCSCLSSMLNKLIIKESGAGKEQLSSFNDFNIDVTSNEQHKNDLIKIKAKFELVAQKYPNINSSFIVLYGKTGVGKTFMSECLANELINKGYFVSFISAFGMHNLFLNYHTSFNEEKQGYINSLIEPDVLVIDDLGTEPFLKNVTNEYLYLILSERSRMKKLTIVTTNLDPNEIINHYNERIFSRLFNKREGFAVVINGTDLRIPRK